MKFDFITMGDSFYENIYNSYWYIEEALIIVPICLFLGILLGGKFNKRKYYFILVIIFISLFVYAKYFSNLSYAN